MPISWRSPIHHNGELIDGELFVTPRPASPHARASSKLGAILDGPFDSGRDGPGGWILLDESELHFDEDVLIPDLGGWRVHGFPTEAQNAPFITVAPDWVCEVVVSSSTARLDRTRKPGVCAPVGVAHGGSLIPLDKPWRSSVSPTGVGCNLLSSVRTDRVRAEPFQDFELELAALWWAT